MCVLAGRSCPTCPPISQKYLKIGLDKGGDHEGKARNLRKAKHMHDTMDSASLLMLTAILHDAGNR